MKRQKDFLQRFSNQRDVLPQYLKAMPVVEIAGDTRVLIENHLGVTEYCNERICAQTIFGSVAVSGEELDLRFMSRHQLVICGRIDFVSIIRRKNE